MSRRLSTSFILFIWVLTAFLSPDVQAQVHVVGEPSLVTALVGDDVTLTCLCDRPVDLTPLTVEWSRAELRPPPSDPLKRMRFVHVYNDHVNDDPDLKMPEFVGRTQLSTEGLMEGVASLRILNVTPNDNGTYKCFIPNLKTERSQRWTRITLIVEANDTARSQPPPEPSPTPRDLDPDRTAPTDRSHVSKVVALSFCALVISVLVVLGSYKLLKTATKKVDRSSQNTEETNVSSEKEKPGADVMLLID